MALDDEGLGSHQLAGKVTPRCALYVNTENITDTRLETGRSPDGIVNTGTPRLVTGGIRCAW